MNQIRIKVIKTFSRFLRGNDDKRVLVLYGGAGSGKSHAVAQYICYRFCTEDDLRILVTRKTGPSLKITSYLLIKDLLAQMSVKYEENRADLIMTRGSSKMFFKSIDDPEKVKSFDANIIWIEEATELTREDGMQLDLRTRRQGRNQLILTFNPIDAFHWCITDLVNKPGPEIAVHHSTHKDNPFLSDQYRKTLESLAEKDYNYYRIYALGEPGVLENVVYTRYAIEDAATWPDVCRSGNPTRLGVDFGFNDPTVVVAVHVKDQERYVKQHLYRSHITNSDLVAFLKQLFAQNRWPMSVEIACDSAEPQRIEELTRAGFNAVPANKDIAYGIDMVKREKLHIDASSVDLIKEIRAYSYRETRDGRVLDEPIDMFNHAMDAMRYAIATGSTNVRNADRLTKMILR